MNPIMMIVNGIGVSEPDADAVADAIGSTATAEWLWAVSIMVGAVAVAIAASRITRRVLTRGLGAGFAPILTGRIVAYTIFLVGLVYALNRLHVQVGPLLGALGLSGLVLALALQKVVENFVGAMILQTRRPFTVGDTIQLGDYVGVVRDIDSRTVVLRGLDGSHIRVPNGSVVAETIVNLTREPLRRSELAVGVAYDTNLEAATSTLTDAVDRVKRVRRVPRPLVALRQFGASSIDFTIYYWHASDVPSELAATHDLMLAVHQAFADSGITIAFPQMVVWSGHDEVDNPYQGRPGEVFVDHPIEQQPRPDHDEEPTRRSRFWGRRSR